MNNLFILLMVILISGCVNFAPKFERPKLSVAELITDNNKKNINLVDWQDFFIDNELTHFIQLALVNNKDLKIALANVAQVQATYKIQKSNIYPNIQINSAFSRTKNSTNTPNNNGENINNDYNLELGLLAYEFDFWGRVKNLQDSALNNYLATLSAQQTIKIAVISTAAEAFYNLIVAYQNLALIDKSFLIENELLALIQLKHKAGLATQLDITTAQIKLAKLKLSKIKANNILSNYKTALELLTGKKIANIANISATSKKIDERLFSLAIPNNLSINTLLNRPDVIAGEYQLKAANANIGVARAMFFPQINLAASIGFQSSELNDLFKTNSKNWSFSPYTSITNLFSDNIQNNLDANKAIKNKKVATYEKTIENAFLEIHRNLQNKKFNQQIIKVNKELVTINKKRLDLIKVKHEQGIENYITVLNTKQALINAQIQKMTTLKNQILININLYKALGGGK